MAEASIVKEPHLVNFAQVKGIRYCLITYKGEMKALGDWAAFFGVSRHFLYQRIFLHGYTVSDAFTLASNVGEQHGMTGTPEWTIWQGMWNRCTVEGNRSYKDYGGRGIVVCDRWALFSNFFNDVGSRPSNKHSLDRIDNNKNYEPCNVRWATRAVQNRNTRHVRYIEFNGQRKIMTDWATEYGITIYQLSCRLRSGWTVERALTEPIRKLRRR